MVPFKTKKINLQDFKIELILERYNFKSISWSIDLILFKFHMIIQALCMMSYFSINSSISDCKNFPELTISETIIIKTSFLSGLVFLILSKMKSIIFFCL